MEGVSSKSRVTPYVFACWLFAAIGGLMFGYNIGISGGVTAMDDFLKKFFPHVLERKMLAADNNYCKYDDEVLQLFTSSLYIAALIASFFASKSCSELGRKFTIMAAASFYIAGAVICGLAEVRWMLILGRILFGIGIGFGNEAVPLYLSEIAPIQHRGAISILFQLLVTIGIFVANLINYGTSKIKRDGWRLSLGLAAIPGCVLLVGSLVIVDTPPSLVERGNEQEGKAVLKKIRAVDNVDVEFKQIVASCAHSRNGKPFRKLFKKSRMPAFIISNMIQVFQQFTGINAVMFYGPVLFQMLGFHNDVSLLSSVIIGLVNVGATFVSVYAVDKVGRRKLLLQASVQMFLSQMAIGIILFTSLDNIGTMNKMLASVVVIFVCTFVMGFAWSWGPMVWLIPSEIYPMETRTAGFALAISTNMMCTFIIAQAFLSMMCRMKACIFFFFSVWIVIMGLFVFFFVPETKNVHINDIDERVWRRHPMWKNFMR